MFFMKLSYHMPRYFLSVISLQYPSIREENLSLSAPHSISVLIRLLSFSRSIFSSKPGPYFIISLLMTSIQRSKAMLSFGSLFLITLLLQSLLGEIQYTQRFLHFILQNNLFQRTRLFEIGSQIRVMTSNLNLEKERLKNMEH